MAPLRFERGAVMLDRVTAETRALVHDEAAVQAVRTALEQSIALRDAAVADDHDPRYLHSARTIRILLADAGCADPVVLCAAARLDTVDRELEPPGAPTDAAVARLLQETPRPEAADLLMESLLCAPADAVLLAAAERLDQARHLHLRPDLDWREFHEQVSAVYAPVAMRTAQLIGHRLDRWADAFRRRLLRG